MYIYTTCNVHKHIHVYVDYMLCTYTCKSYMYVNMYMYMYIYTTWCWHVHINVHVCTLHVHVHHMYMYNTCYVHKRVHIYVNYMRGGRAFARMWKSAPCPCKRPPTTFSRLPAKRHLGVCKSGYGIFKWTFVSNSSV